MYVCQGVEGFIEHNEGRPLRSKSLSRNLNQVKEPVTGKSRGISGCLEGTSSANTLGNIQGTEWQQW